MHCNATLASTIIYLLQVQKHNILFIRPGQSESFYLQINLPQLFCYSYAVLCRCNNYRARTFWRPSVKSVTKFPFSYFEVNGYSQHVDVVLFKMFKFSNKMSRTHSFQMSLLQWFPSWWSFCQIPTRSPQLMCLFLSERLSKSLILCVLSFWRWDFEYLPV